MSTAPDPVAALVAANSAYNAAVSSFLAAWKVALDRSVDVQEATEAVDPLHSFRLAALVAANTEALMACLTAYNAANVGTLAGETARLDREFFALLISGGVLPEPGTEGAQDNN